MEKKTLAIKWNDRNGPENWLDVLEPLAEGTAKLKPGGFQDDFVGISNAAAKWPACACGQTCRLLPRNSEEMPHDTLLQSWGRQFATQVYSHDWKEALATFKKIEARATKLMLELGIIKPEPVAKLVSTSYAATLIGTSKKKGIAA